MGVRARGAKKKGIVGVIILAVLLLVMIAGIYLFIEKWIISKYTARIDDLTNLIEQNTWTVYFAKEDIAAGDIVTANKLYTESVLQSRTQGAFTKEDIGKVALVDIPAETAMFSNDVAELPEGMQDRLHEISCFFIPQSVKEGTYIDVRIRMQTSEDYVVLSKKRVEKISESGLTCFLKLTEYEIQLLTSAIIDGKQMDATIYADAYVAPTVQEESTVTYVPRHYTIDVLNSLGLIDLEQYEVFHEYRNGVNFRYEEMFPEESKPGKLEKDEIRDTAAYGNEDILDTNEWSTDRTNGEKFDFGEGEGTPEGQEPKQESN